MQPEVPDNIPGTDDSLLAAVAGILPTLPSINAEDADRFAQAVRAIVENRAQRGWPNEGDADVAVFVMVDYPRQVGQKHGSKPFLDLIAKDGPLLGRLFLANRDSSGGHAITIPVASNSLIDWLDDNELSARPVLMVYRTSKTMVTRRAGIADLAEQAPIRDCPPTATLEQLLAALDHFHKDRLLTPSCCPEGVWEPGRAHQYIPGPQPEKSIQKALEFALNFRFQGVVRAEVEDKTNIGRIDVRLLKRSSHEGSLAYRTIVELKITKSFAHATQGTVASTVATAANVDAIVKGIKQAWAYRENRSAEEGLLEIYDLRKIKNQDLLQHMEVAAAMAECVPVPTHHVRPVFGTADDAREAGFSGA